MAWPLVVTIPQSTYADGQVVMSILRVGIGETIVNEVTLPVLVCIVPKQRDQKLKLLGRSLSDKIGFLL